MPSDHSSALSPAHAELLFAVWRWETDQSGHGRPVSSRELADKLGSRPAQVQRLIRSIMKISPKSLEIFPHQTGLSKRGRPIDSYRLNQDEIVTFPETAFILLQLITFPTDEPYRVNRPLFQQRMQELGLSAQLVADRIDANIKVGYVREYGFPGYISPRTRSSVTAPSLKDSQRNATR